MTLDDHRDFLGSRETLCGAPVAWTECQRAGLLAVMHRGAGCL